MTSYPVPKPPPTAVPGARPVVPRLAASLVLVREGAAGTEVLMGQRSAGHRFMPNRLVFPGGRVDRRDRLGPLAVPVHSAITAQFPNAARAVAAVVAAIRETFEEAGLRVAAAPTDRGVPARGGWAGFCAGGVLPTPAPLSYLCRLITPRVMPIRFDTHFFVADASAATGELGGSGELELLRFMPVEEARGFDLALPTRIVLDELAAWLALSERDGHIAPVYRDDRTRMIRTVATTV